jgi:hypothetical protein
MYGRRVIVPVCLRCEVMNGLHAQAHAAHQCVTKMHDRAMHAVFWLGLYKGFKGVGNNCSYCNKSTPTEAALPPHEHHSPDDPFQMVFMDYCSIKCKSWLICADRFTGWVSTYYFPKETDASDLVKLLKEYFVTFGVRYPGLSCSTSTPPWTGLSSPLRSSCSAGRSGTSNLSAQDSSDLLRCGWIVLRRGSLPCTTGCPWG